MDTNATKRYHQPSVGGSVYSSVNSAASNDVRTFIFGELSREEKDKFIDFMIKNNVQFQYDG